MRFVARICGGHSDLLYVARAIAKSVDREYTARLTCAPFFKVSQVEIEAGDCEGRLPLHFVATFVLGTLYFEISC